MRIYLTGSSGFLGSRLARHWISRGHDLWLLVRPTSKLDRLQDLPASVNVLRAYLPEEIIATVRMAAPDVIVHTACSYGRKGENALDVMDANLRLGTVLLQAVLDNQVSELGPTTFMNTGTALESGVSLYALSKTQFSAWGAELASQAPERIRFIDIRLQQIFGPGDDRSKFTTHVIEACRNNEMHLALSPGEQLRDFIHIDDVLRAYELILDRRSNFSASDFIDVGTGKAVTMRKFVELTKHLAGASTKLDFGAVAYRKNEAMLCVADTSRLCALGWKPEISLADGIKRMINAAALR